MGQVIDKHLPEPNRVNIMFLNLSHEFHNKLKIPKVIWISNERELVRKGSGNQVSFQSSSEGNIWATAYSYTCHV